MDGAFYHVDAENGSRFRFPVDADVKKMVAVQGNGGGAGN
jgi:hypothetical protein